MSKLKELKEAMKNTPADRLAKIEYQSHFLSILGTLFVSTVLIFKGYWYVIFAFIFSLGVSYSQGIGAYQKYLILVELNPYKLNTDKSLSRRRNYIIEKQLGDKVKYIIGFLSVGLAVFIFNPEGRAWYIKLSFGLLSMFLYTINYYIVTYSVANYYYKRVEKEVK